MFVEARSFSLDLMRVYNTERPKDDSNKEAWRPRGERVQEWNVYTSGGGGDPIWCDLRFSELATGVIYRSHVQEAFKPQLLQRKCCETSGALIFGGGALIFGVVL